MLPGSCDPFLVWCERAIYETRAQYDTHVLRCWRRLLKRSNSPALRRRMIKLLEPYVEDEKLWPLIITRQPGLESNVWHGLYPLGEVVDAGIPSTFDPDQYSTGPVTLTCGSARSGKSTLNQNFVRGFLLDGRAIVTIVDPQGSNTFLTEEFPGLIDAINLHQVPMGLFQEPLLRAAVLSDWAEIYNSKLSRSELSHADADLGSHFTDQHGNPRPYSLRNLLEYLQGPYWRNPLDPTRGLRRTLCMGLEGLLRRCPGFSVAAGAEPARDLFSKNLVLVTEDFRDILDLRFVCTFLLRSLFHSLQNIHTQQNVLRHVIFFDDALDIFHRDADATATAGISPLVNMLTKIGKWGVATFILSQSLLTLSEALQANSQNMIVTGSFANDLDLKKATIILGMETRQ